jgi:predicted Zn finger-like uncharacterized protein
MPIRTTCPSCRTVYTLADHYAGKTVRCKECEGPIVVRAARGRTEDDESESDSGARGKIQTQPRAGASSERSSPARARPRRRDREDEDEWDLEDSRAQSNRGLVIGLIVVSAGLVLLLGGGALAVILLTGRSGSSGASFLSDIEAPANADAVDKALFELKSSDPHKRREAARQLKDMLPDERRGEVIQALGPLVNDSDFFTRKFAIEALGVWGNKDAVPILLKAMQDKQTRGDVMKALGHLKDERAAEPLAARLEDFFDQHFAEEALKEMGTIAEKAVLARLNHHDLQVRMAVCRVLAAIGTNQSIPALEKAVAAGKDPFAGENHFVAMEAKRTIQAIKARQN